LSVYHLKFSNKIATVTPLVSGNMEPSSTYQCCGVATARRLFFRLLFTSLRAKNVGRKSESNNIAGFKCGRLKSSERFSHWWQSPAR
jgi:hypothetical protein